MFLENRKTDPKQVYATTHTHSFHCIIFPFLVHCESDKLPLQITSNNGGAGASSSPISSGSSSSSASVDPTYEDKNFESNGQHRTGHILNQPPVISKDVAFLKVCLCTDTLYK